MAILQKLRNQLQSERGIERVDAAIVIGLVQETQLYDDLAKAFSTEKNAKIKKHLKWAGQRLDRARKANHTTIESIWKVFRLQREVDNHFKTKEDKLLKSILDSPAVRGDDTPGAGSAAKAAGTLLGGMAFGPSAVVGGMMGGSGDVMSSGLGKGIHESMEKRRTPPTRPSDMNISIQLKRLQNATEAEKQRRLMIDLCSFNNPEALPVIAKVYLISQDETVRQTAEESGKNLYWMVRYWELDQAGEIQKLIDQRIEASG